MSDNFLWTYSNAANNHHLPSEGVTKMNIHFDGVPSLRDYSVFGVGRWCLVHLAWKLWYDDLLLEVKNPPYLGHILKIPSQVSFHLPLHSYTSWCNGYLCPVVVALLTYVHFKRPNQTQIHECVLQRKFPNEEGKPIAVGTRISAY